VQGATTASNPFSRCCKRTHIPVSVSVSVHLLHLIWLHLVMGTEKAPKVEAMLNTAMQCHRAKRRCCEAVNGLTSSWLHSSRRNVRF
jgi:hypothetical protein